MEEYKTYILGRKVWKTAPICKLALSLITKSNGHNMKAHHSNNSRNENIHFIMFHSIKYNKKKSLLIVKERIE